MAEICLAYGMTPTEYRQLTLLEHQAFESLLTALKKDKG